MVPPSVYKPLVHSHRLGMLQVHTLVRNPWIDIQKENLKFSLLKIMYTVMEGWKQWRAISCAHHLICLWADTAIQML